VKFARILPALLLFIAAPAAKAQAPPTFHVSHPPKSNINFEVDASVSIKGAFKKWDATLTCPSTDALKCVLEIKIQADSVDTGSGMKDGKLKGGDFFDVKDNPYITFKSTKIVPTGPNTSEIDGDFTIRGVTKPEKLVLTVAGAGTGTGSIAGTMAFDRKDYGMNKGIPFIKIADRVQVTCDLHITRTSGPALVFPKS
jgi:polyisoprenoid-binding protein YceI